MRQASERVVNPSLELGGNAGVIVTDDADLRDAVAGVMVAKFRNGGQACTAANRIFVHASVHDEFVSMFGAEVEKLRVGAAAEGADIGPLINAGAVERITTTVERAVAEGACISHRAQAPDGPGHFYPPTVLTRLASDAAILSEELFAPVAPVVSWCDEDEVINQVNSTEHGLAAYVFGELSRALRLAERIEAGMVGINRGVVSDPSAPFGGVKQSGLGREGGHDGLREFQETQYISVDWPARAGSS